MANIVRVLLEHGANISVEDDEGRTVSDRVVERISHDRTVVLASVE